MTETDILHDRIFELATPEVELLGLELADLEVFSGGRRYTLRFAVERYVDSSDFDDLSTENEARRVSIAEVAQASRAIARAIEIEEAEKGEFLGRYTIEVSSPGIFRRLRRPEHYRRHLGEIVKISAEVDTESGTRKVMQYRGTLLEADAKKVTVEDAKRGDVSLPLNRIRRANLDPDLDFGRKDG